MDYGEIVLDSPEVVVRLDTQTGKALESHKLPFRVVSVGLRPRRSNVLVVEGGGRLLDNESSRDVRKAYIGGLNTIRSPTDH